VIPLGSLEYARLLLQLIRLPELAVMH